MRYDIRPTAAAAVTNLVATPGVRSITLTWDPLPAGTRAKVYLNKVDTTFSQALEVAEVDGNTYTHVGMAVATHNYWVRAVNEYGREDGPVSNMVTVQSQLVGELDIAAGAVKAAMLDIAAIDSSTGMLKEGVAPPAEIADGAITSVKLAEGAVTAAKTTIASIDPASGNLKVNSVTTNSIVAGAITGVKIAAGEITGSKIAARTIGAGHIVAGSITATEIASRSITADKIAAGSITANEISSAYVYAGDISAERITSGKMVGDRITGGTITGASFHTSVLNTGARTVIHGSNVSNGTDGYVFRNKIMGYNASNLLTFEVDTVLGTLNVKHADSTKSALGIESTINSLDLVYLSGTGGGRGLHVRSNSPSAPTVEISQLTTSGVGLRVSSGAIHVAGTIAKIGGGSVNCQVTNADYAASAGYANTAGSVSSVSGSSVVGAVASANYAGTSGEVTHPGNAALNAQNGTKKAIMQTDGKFVVYHSGSPVWAHDGSVSDRRYKQNIVPTARDCLGLLNALRVVDFQWDPTTPLDDGGLVHTGFIAQEVEKVYPRATSQTGDTKMLRQDALIPLLVKSVQELTARVRALEAQLGL